MGGQLGIDIGRVLSQNPRSRLRVIGIVMIDTLFPYWGPPETPHAELSVDLVFKNCPPDMKAEMLRCMQYTKEDSDAWVLRNWKGGNADVELDGIEEIAPVAAVLLLGKKFVPVAGLQTGGRVMVDYMRDARLGWDLFPHQFIAATWEIPAHHFGLFEKNMVS